MGCCCSSPVDPDAFIASMPPNSANLIEPSSKPLHLVMLADGWNYSPVLFAARRRADGAALLQVPGAGDVAIRGSRPSRGSARQHLPIYDASGQDLVAVLVQKRPGMLFEWVLYSTKPRVPGQPPSTRVTENGSHESTWSAMTRDPTLDAQREDLMRAPALGPLYSWAKLVLRPGCTPRLNIYLATGDDAYSASPSYQGTCKPGGAVLCLSPGASAGRTGCLHVQPAAELPAWPHREATYEQGVGVGGGLSQLVVGPGADPALMVATALVLHKAFDSQPNAPKTNYTSI